MNLLLLEEAELTAEGRAQVTGARAEHVRDVLRSLPGQRLRVGVRNGRVGSARVETLDASGLWLDEVVLDAPPPPRAGVHLVLAMPRPKALRRILPAIASLGVNSVVLLNATRVDRAYLDSPVLAPESVQRLFDLGLEQAQDTVGPRFRLELRFRPFVEDVLPSLVEGSTARWLLHPGVGADRTTSHRREGERWLAVGPETGWTDFERGLLAAAGFTELSFGTRLLRVETVVPYAIGHL